MSSDLGKLGAYSASLSMSLIDQGKAVARMLEAGQNKVDVTKEHVTDNALEQIQRDVSHKDEMIRVGSKLSIFA